ncbi:hypothetical protein OTB20_39305 [Streptomyces sp. H27-H1]|uniref:hypothetical protein n=1 Tax=Streptomyces sp. H27-H1 TaxID=2996461 RepID=UPI00226D6A9F|nr:hypothetical protein [Streptomyces sp. H27-H1]MCY0932119.1 hypothetical protein [Streptomyces sp. H27-H1]
MSVDLGAAWCATDLGDHRPCRYTYERYPYDTLPPLDAAQFTGAFQWLGDPGKIVPGQVADLQKLGEKLAAEGLELPADFVRFYTSSNLQDSLDEVSVTGCWSSLSEPLPSPVEPGAFLIRFFRDQQDCVLWYLYLRPSGEAFVVHSYLDYEHEYEARGSEDFESESDLDDLTAQEAAILWCAPSFEHFAYRFWLENRLWHAVNGGSEVPLDSAMQEYLDHYKAPSLQEA